MTAAAACAGCLIALTTAPPAAMAQRDSREISLEARSSEIDRRNDRLVFNDVVITQGDLGIEAGLAVGTGLSFEDSDWTFSRDVRLTSEGATIGADEAVLSFRSNQLVHARLLGSPVTFERASTRVPGRLTRGQAARADYDLETDSVRLSGDAWLCEGSNEITSDTIVYDLAAERVLADAGGESDGRVRILITPSEEGDGEPGPCTAPPFPSPPASRAPASGGTAQPPAPEIDDTGNDSGDPPDDPPDDDGNQGADTPAPDPAP
jgi:lipopolysaccharide transport protein LptA